MAPNLLNSNRRILKFFHAYYAQETFKIDWSIDNMKKKTRLNGYIYDFSVDYDAADDILDIYKYLIKKNNMI